MRFPELIYDIIFNPRETFREVSIEKIYKLPLFIVIFVSFFLLTLSNINYNFTTFFIFLFKTVNLIIYWLMFGFFVDFVAKIFRSEGNIQKLLTLLSFSFVPWIFLAPLKLLKHSPFVTPAILLILAVWIWTVALQVLAISETYNISRKNAILLLLLPFIASIIYFVWTIDFWVKIFQISSF